MRIKILLLTLMIGLLIWGCDMGNTDDSEASIPYQAYICYSDGTYSNTVDTNKTPVGIAIETDNKGKPTKMIHLKQKSLEWCMTYADAYGKELDTSTKDGSGNWQVICDAVTDEETVGHYPAFEYVNSLTEYGGGWYIPAYTELNQIRLHKDAINKVLSSLSDAGFDVDSLSTSWCWSSSAFIKYGYANIYTWAQYLYTETDAATQDGIRRDTRLLICAIRSF